MVEEYHNKLFDKNNLNMYYFNIIYVNDNIIEIGTTGRSHIGCKDSQWIDYGELYRKRKNCNSLDECITRFFERICICKPKDYPIFLTKIKNKQLNFVSNDGFENDGNNVKYIFQELAILNYL